MGDGKLDQLPAARAELEAAGRDVWRQIRAASERLRQYRAPAVDAWVDLRDGRGRIGWAKVEGVWTLAYQSAEFDEALLAERAPLDVRLELLGRLGEIVDAIVARARELAEQARRAGS